MEKQNAKCKGCVMESSGRLPLLCIEQCKDNSFNKEKENIIEPIHYSLMDESSRDASSYMIDKINEIILFINQGGINVRR